MVILDVLDASQVMSPDRQRSLSSGLAKQAFDNQPTSGELGIGTRGCNHSLMAGVFDDQADVLGMGKTDTSLHMGGLARVNGIHWVAAAGAGGFFPSERTAGLVLEIRGNDRSRVLDTETDFGLGRATCSIRRP